MSLYVSAFYENINSHRDTSFYLNNSLPFLKAPVNKLIFVNQKLYDENFKKFENEYTIFIILNEIPFQKYAPNFTEYKINTSNGKDTLEYVLLQCSKTEFLKKAILEYPEYQRYTWIDLGISYVVKNDTLFTSLLSDITHYRGDKIRIPGCWDLNIKYNIDLSLHVAWYFCGGLFSGNKESLLKFAELMEAKIIEFSKLKYIMWEVNLCYLIYLENPQLFDWYKADHNVTMLSNFLKGSIGCIDKILYINLDHRIDKKTYMEDELKRYNLSAERFPGVYHSNTAYGCSMAHLGAIKYAKAMGYKNVLILEDDFTFLVDRETFQMNLTKFFNTGIHFDILMLSYKMNLDEATPYDFIGRVLYAQTASAYLINGHYFDTLIKLYEETFPLLLKTGEHWNYMNDVIWRKLQAVHTWYYFKERIGKQRACVNDNGGVFTDNDC